MSKKRFNGVRVRVEGERARHASRVVAGRGYTIKQEGRLGDDTGYIIRTVEGPVINLYDTGSILISGNGRPEFGSVDEFRPPDVGTGVLILSADDEALRNLVACLTVGAFLISTPVSPMATGWERSPLRGGGGYISWLRCRPLLFSAPPGAIRRTPVSTSALA